MHATNSTAISPTASATNTTPAPAGVLRAGIASGVVAAAATTIAAAVAKAADVAVAVAHEAIPLAGFVQLTFIGAVIGTAIAAVLARRSHRARTMFIRITVTLTALSIVPDLAVSTDTATRLTLIATHLVAAAIVIPALASRLTNNR
jgi:Family of unknown function (DUF6069)